MLTSECVTTVQVAARLDDSDDDYTAARIREELNQTLRETFGRLVVNSRDGSGTRTGYWRKQLITTTTAMRTRYRLPHRALVGVGESIELSDVLGSGSYEIVGDQIVYLTAPTAGSQHIVSYYLRPSVLVAEQTTGLISAVDTTLLTVTVNTAPTDRVTAAAVVTGDTLDIVHPNGWHELALVNTTATKVSTLFTFPTGTDLSDVEVGDYLRKADQTDWPCLPDEIHPALCWLTGANILRSKGHEQKAVALEKKAAAGLEAFADLIEPRIKDGRNLIIPTVGVLRGRPSPRWPRTAV